MRDDQVWPAGIAEFPVGRRSLMGMAGVPMLMWTKKVPVPNVGLGMNRSDSGIRATACGKLLSWPTLAIYSYNRTVLAPITYYFLVLRSTSVLL
jgi:hypothetical protein